MKASTWLARGPACQLPRKGVSHERIAMIAKKRVSRSRKACGQPCRVKNPRVNFKNDCSHLFSELFFTRKKHPLICFCIRSKIGNANRITFSLSGQFLQRYQATFIQQLNFLFSRRMSARKNLMRTNNFAMLYKIGLHDSVFDHRIHAATAV